MKIAVTYDESNGEIFQHFGQTPAFKIYEVEDLAIKDTDIISTGPCSHAALVAFLNDLHVDVLISGGIGMDAKVRLENVHIQLFGGAKGSADQAVKDYLEGHLEYDPLAAEHHGPCHH